MVFSSFSSIALADLNLEISGNGADSNNTVVVQSSNTNVVTQTNNANISNNIDVSTDTGDNKANKNTGGNVTVATGDATSSVGVTNNANSNTAQVKSCGSCLGDLQGKISGNGADSDNALSVDVESTNFVTQQNTADVSNNVNVKADTGDNKANKNTGGNVEISTGDADAHNVSVNTRVNANEATIGGNGGSSHGLSLWITGNGADSDNAIALKVNNANVVDQSNYADITNSISVKADTGDNKANKNTGGGASISTGDADAHVSVDNMANFNMADVEGCCLLGGTVKVGGNGADSENKLGLALETANFATQTNSLECGRDQYLWDYWYGKGSCASVRVNNDTGDNKANENTSHNGDPSIETGDAGSSISVDNSGNANGLTIGGDAITGHDVEIPAGFPFGSNSLLGFLMVLFGHSA